MLKFMLSFSIFFGTYDIYPVVFTEKTLAATFHALYLKIYRIFYTYKTTERLSTKYEENLEGFEHDKKNLV